MKLNQDSRKVEAAQGPGRGLLLSMARVFLGIAFGITLFLVVTGRGPSMERLGCGVEGSCHEVTGSVWAWWGPLPLSMVGLSGYAFLLILLWAGGQRLEVPRSILPVLLFGAASGGFGFSLWLIAVQQFILHHYCGFCMSAHLFGIIGFTLVLVLVTLGTPSGRRSHRWRWFPVAPLGLIALHILIPVHQTAVAEVGTGEDTSAPYQGQGLQLGKKSQSRMVTFAKGDIQLDVWQVPLQGPESADVVVVKLFDYSCAACRKLHQALKKYEPPEGRKLAVVCYPVPMHPECNPLVKKHHPGFQNSCELARLALAVYVQDRKSFPLLHEVLLGAGRTVSIQEAREQAEKLIGRENLDKGLADPRVEQSIRDGVAMQEFLGVDQVPQLLIGDRIFSYGGGSTRDIDKALDEAFAK